MSRIVGPVAAVFVAASLHFLSGQTPQKTPAPQDKEVQRATGYIRPSPEKERYFKGLSRARHGDRITRAAKNLSLPAKFDCRERVPYPIGDQGQCGSCYLYSTIDYTFTCAGIYAGVGKAGAFKLSVQYGMDRPRSFGGCNGGWGVEVADWATKNGWIAEVWVDASGVTHKDYPAYEARVGTDRTAPGAKVWCKGWTWGYVNPDRPPTVDEIKAAMYLHGRLNIALDAGGQFGSGKGTITALGTQINHEISVCAWDDNKDGGAFLLENQWSQQWGDGGYRWCTYKAAKNIEDWFWVSAGDPVPPPPPPGGVPVVTGGTVAAQVNQPFSFQIQATNSPVAYDAFGLPAGLSVEKASGKIAGTPTAEGVSNVTLTASNASGVGAARLILTVGTTPPPPPPPVGTVASVTITFTDGTTQQLFPVTPQTTIGEMAGWAVKATLPAQPDPRIDQLQQAVETLAQSIQAINRVLESVADPKEKEKKK